MGRKIVVLVPCPFQGHITPMLQLGTILHSKGFSIIIAHAKLNSPNPSSHPDFIFLPMSDNLTGAEISGGFPVFVKLINSNCRAPLQEDLSRVIENQDPGDRVACIIYDMLMYVAESVASHLDLPSIAFHSSSASFLLAHSSQPWLHAEGYLPLKDSTLHDLVPELHPLQFKDLSFSDFGSFEDSLELIASTTAIRTSSAIIFNTMDFLEHSSLTKLLKQYKVPLFPIGPMHKMAPATLTSLINEEISCLTWLDNQAPKSVIYVSFGTLVTMNEKEITEMAWGLAKSDQRFLWVVRPGSVHGSEWIELLPKGFTEEIGERGLIVKWAPQTVVLAHGAVGGFWSHCGWNSSLESICEGVPMICRPGFADQKVNARYLTSVWRVGLELECVLERGEVEKVIRRLIVDKEGDEVRQRANAMKEMAEACIREGGTSCSSVDNLVELMLC